MNLILNIIVDFNVSKKYQIVGRSFVLEEIPFNFRANYFGSPKMDLLNLVKMLKDLLMGDDSSEYFEAADTLIEFSNMANNLTSSRPDYDSNAFRNILKTELEKHINQSDFDTFEWQRY